MRNPITPRLMAKLAARDESLMNTTFTLRRVTRTDDGAAGWTEAESTESVLGYMKINGGVEKVGADQVMQFGRHLIFLPLGTDVEGIDRISNPEGRAFDVVYVFPQDEYSTDLTLGVSDA